MDTELVRFAIIGEMLLILGCSYFVYWFNREELSEGSAAVKWMCVALLGIVAGVALVVFANVLLTDRPTPGAKILSIYSLPFLVMSLYAVHLSLERFHRVMSSPPQEARMSDTTPTPPTSQLRPTKATVGAVIALIVAGALVLYTALSPDENGVVAVTAQEWVGILLAVLGSPAAVGAGVYHTTNKPK